MQMQSIAEAGTTKNAKTLLATAQNSHVNTVFEEIDVGTGKNFGAAGQTIRSTDMMAQQ